VDIPPIARQLASEEYARFRIFSRAEIVSLLVGLEDDRSPVTLYFDDTSFIVSRVLSVDSANKMVIVDMGAHAETNARLLASEEILAITTLHNVTLEFSLRGAHEVQLPDGPALRAGLPEFMLRLQRRENFRVPTPVLRPVNITVPALKADAPRINLRVTDISCGGLGVEGEGVGLTLESGRVLDDCIFDLPEVGQVVASVEVRHLESSTDSTGKTRVRCGLRFLTLSPQMSALVQRYVMRLEREWRALR
jgi:flagellar brake protein